LIKYYQGQTQQSIPVNNNMYASGSQALKETPDGGFINEILFWRLVEWFFSLSYFSQF